MGGSVATGGGVGLTCSASPDVPESWVAGAQAEDKTESNRKHAAIRPEPTK
jgi:hypothetical protein